MSTATDTKPETDTLEFASENGGNAAGLTIYQDVSDEYPAKKKSNVLWKIDIRIIPILMVLYILSYIDRANIGNAKIEGMVEDLGLSSTQYNTVLSIFFVTYILCEIPSNYILERWFEKRPSLWIGIITVLWGVSQHGVVHNYGGIMAARLLMGVFEAGLFPGAIAFLTKWYTKFELATRLAIFYVGSALAGAFSGLLAFAIAKMDGVAGLEGWRWIFIIEGIATVAVGVLTPWALADTPNSRPKWLNTEEQDYLIRRMIVQNGGEQADKAGKHLSGSLLLAVVTDWQYYPLVLVNWANVIPSYGLKFTLPQIIKNMGFTNSNAQLLSIPPYVAGAISAVVFNVISDKFRRRSVIVIVPQMLLVVSYSILTPLAPKISANIAPCFFAIILANIGCYPVNPISSSWLSNNTAGSAKRSLAIAYYISLSNVGGIIASYIFIDSEKPGYPTGFGLSLTFSVTGIIAALLLNFMYTRINKKRDLISPEEIAEKYTDEELAVLGNRSPLFRYTK
ncbi:MFS general substrate transporter [Fusarium austroafricanum]|uniref:MFS general substrate transporter n=1 Tax=Fusarium austroafricanum TaxID=2364996 RepID=A0A8H4KHJ0_9HYPO|nr:MFS general substrate transporter [Fusarium austroafricanum]